jgi:hypothetical protein
MAEGKPTKAVPIAKKATAQAKAPAKNVPAKKAPAATKTA